MSSNSKMASFLDLHRTALSVFAKQLQVERDARQQGFEACKPGWRNTLPTWTHWGVASAGANAAEEEAAGGEESIKREANKLNVDLIFDHLDIFKAFPPKLAGGECIESKMEEEHAFTTRVTLGAPEGMDVKPFMFSKRGEGSQFHIVDLDISSLDRLVFAPFDSAVQCCANRGMICITADTNAVLRETGTEALARSGNSEEAFAHELAMRLVLATLERQANRNSKYSVPLLAAQRHGKIHVFARIYAGSLREVNRSVLRIANVFQCEDLSAHEVIPLSTESTREGKQGKVGLTPISPSKFSFDQVNAQWRLASTQIWGAPIMNQAFAQACAKAAEGGELGGFFAQLASELVDAPLLYSIAQLKHKYGACCELEAMSNALHNAGFQVSTNASAQTFKTSANSQVVGEIVRAWIKQQQTTAVAPPANATARKFLEEQQQEGNARVVVDFAKRHKLQQDE